MADETELTSGGSQKRKGDDGGCSIRSVRQKMEEAPRHGRRMVTVRVGPNQESFDVHENLLTAHSNFFAAALKQPWKEARERTVELPEREVEHFEIFIYFLYSGKIFSSKDGDDRDAGEVRSSLEWSRLSKCWALGEVIQSTSFKDAVTDALIAKALAKDRSPSGIYRSIYPASSSSSTIRKLLVDIALWCWDDEMFARIHGQGPNLDFCSDLSAALFKIKRKGLQGSPPFKAQDLCVYHKHKAESKPCYKTMF